MLHPAGLRDFLVRVAQTGLFRAHWSDDILNEMVSSVLRRRPDIDEADLQRTRQLMCDAVPGSVTTGYHGIISGLSLPDPDDRHVLAAAIRSGSQVIVTQNVRDFPSSALADYDIEAQTPDTFVLYLIDLAPATIAHVIQAQAAALTNPPMSISDVRNRLVRSGLPRSMAALQDQYPFAKRLLGP